MRALLPFALVMSAFLVACNQDSAASNAERDTHMGSVRAVSTAVEVSEAGPLASAAPSPSGPAPDADAP